MSSIKPEEVAYHGRFRLYNAESSHAKGYRVEFQLGTEDDYRTFKGLTKRKKNKAGIIFRCYLAGRNAIVFDGYFVGWGVSNALGAKVRFDLMDMEIFNAFRDLPALVQNEHAVEWNAVLLELSDNGDVVNQSQRESVETMKGGPLSQHAGKLCADKSFQRFVGDRLDVDGPPGKRVASPDECAAFIRERCRIESRRELDHDKAAAERYHRWVTKPFAIATA